MCSYTIASIFSLFAAGYKNYSAAASVSVPTFCMLRQFCVDVYQELTQSKNVGYLNGFHIVSSMRVISWCRTPGHVQRTHK